MVRKRAALRGAAGFTSIEVVVAIVIAAIAIPGLVIGFFQYAEATADAALRERAVALASGLLEEILGKSFEDAALATGSFGAEEPSRLAWDDVDDYDGYAAAPPEDSAGTALSGLGSFSQSVAVENVTAAAPDPATPAPNGSTPYKRVTVTVSWSGGSFVLKGLAARIDVAAGDTGTGFTYLAGSRQSHGDDDFDFRVVNGTGSARTLTSLIAIFGPPASYFEQVRIRVIGGSNYGTVWNYTTDFDGRAGTGDRASFGGPAVVVPAGATFEIRLRQFRTAEFGGGGSSADVEAISFDVILGIAGQDFEEFTVPIAG